MVESKKANGGMENDEELQRWEERMNKHCQWQKKHQVCEVKPGDKLDVLDTEYIWCVATVELKI